jgi:hypothetical protein
MFELRIRNRCCAAEHTYACVNVCVSVLREYVHNVRNPEGATCDLITYVPLHVAYARVAISTCMGIDVLTCGYEYRSAYYVWKCMEWAYIHMRL